MTAKNKIKLILVLLLLLIIAWVNYAYHNFRVVEKFTPIPLAFNPADSSSNYEWNGNMITVQGGFVKGLVGTGVDEELLLRSLSPQPRINVKNNSNDAKTLNIRIENINPVNVVTSDNSNFVIVDPHTIKINVQLNIGEVKNIELIPQTNQDFLEVVILGDNRDGYSTFAQIIDQINGINPIFAIDNGDLVFGGEPNKYRLFNETVSKLQVPLYTTLGNHDIRENGRPVYTELFGPPYYSFNYRDTHFVFLDSSRGWSEKTAIPEEQYQWLENDLKQAQGKQIFVFSHIPPEDPRNTLEPNILPDIPGVQETPFFEKLMGNYTRYKNMNHAFPDPEEAQRFESLMSKYQVNTVFLSHIHSYFNYIKGGVRYIISGGGGAELLSKDSYYHYIRVQISGKENYLEVVQLPSPVNQLQDRYIAAVQLFANAIYKEYRLEVWSIAFSTALVLAGLLWITRGRWLPRFKITGIWLLETLKFAISKYRELKRGGK